MNAELILKLLPLLMSSITQSIQFIHDIQQHLKQNGELTAAQEKELDDRIAALKSLPWWQPS